MRQTLIRFIFRLLGHSYTRNYGIPYLFGAHTAGHEARKKKWEKALVRLWRDKDLLDFLYYQAEADKENVFRGKTRKDLSVGARLRTLFLVYSAHRAHLLSLKKAGENVRENDESDREMRTVGKIYKELTDIA